MKFMNLTPHAITIMPASGGSVNIAPSGALARCKAERALVGELEIDGLKVPVTSVTLGDIEGLPAPEEGTIYIVSLAAAQRAAREGRIADIVVPDEAVRDDAGKIIGCRALARQDS